MSKNYITFIFDDGPREPMCEMVDKIAAYGWSAGFAVVGNSISDETQSQLEYAVDKGFELVAHGQTHVSLISLETKEEIVEEFIRPIIDIKNRIGYDVKTARLPYIFYNDLVLETARELKLPLMGSGINGGKDWSSESTPESITDSVLGSVVDGAIACMHVTQNTCKALDVILPELKARDYELVAPCELFKIKNIDPIPLGINISNVNKLDI